MKNKEIPYKRVYVGLICLFFLLFNSFITPFSNASSNKDQNLETEGLYGQDWLTLGNNQDKLPCENSNQVTSEELYQEDLEYKEADKSKYDKETEDQTDIDYIAATNEKAENEDTEKTTWDKNNLVNIKNEYEEGDWRLVLVNKQNMLPEDFEVKLGTFKGGYKCDERIIDDLKAMFDAASKENCNLVICSPYRDYNRQQNLFNKKVKFYMKKKNSYLESYRKSAQSITIPGSSEHQTGLALDIVSSTHYSLNDGFGTTDAGKWLLEHSFEYGFILRYPLGKENITGIEYEPWHFRYVGKAAATYITKHGITLEEFLDMNADSK